MDGRARASTPWVHRHPPEPAPLPPSGTWSPGHAHSPPTVIPVTGTTEPGAPHHAFHRTPRPDDGADPGRHGRRRRRRGRARLSAATWAPRTSESFDPQRDLDEFESRILIRVNRAARPARPLRRSGSSSPASTATPSGGRRSCGSSGELVHRDLGAVLDGCDLNWVGENLVSGTGLRPRAAVRAWMDSPAAPPGADEAPRRLGRRRCPGRQRRPHVRRPELRRPHLVPPPATRPPGRAPSRSRPVGCRLLGARGVHPGAGGRPSPRARHAVRLASRRSSRRRRTSSASSASRPTARVTGRPSCSPRTSAADTRSTIPTRQATRC